MEIVVLIAHSRGSHVLIVFFLLLARYYFVKLTHLYLHILLICGDRAEFVVDVLVDRVQIIKSLWVKNSLASWLRLYLVLIVLIGILVLSVREIPVIWSWLVIIINLGSLISIWVTTSLISIWVATSLLLLLSWSKRNISMHFDRHIYRLSIFIVRLPYFIINLIDRHNLFRLRSCLLRRNVSKNSELK